MNFKELRNVLFLDIETVSLESDFANLSLKMQDLWRRKSIIITRNKDLDDQGVSDAYTHRAGIYAEFAKVVCITVSYLKIENKKIQSIKIKSFYGHDEKSLLTSFCGLLDQYYNNPSKHFLSGHNIKEFDLPFICRRLVIHGIPLPKLLNLSGRKPWQLNYVLDTLELWKFGDYKNYTSLNLLAAILGIDSPKDDIDGSQVGHVYWEEDDLDRIVKYCEKDVITTVRVFLKLHRIEIKASIYSNGKIV